MNRVCSEPTVVHEFLPTERTWFHERFLKRSLTQPPLWLLHQGAYPASELHLDKRNQSTLPDLKTDAFIVLKSSLQKFQYAFLSNSVAGLWFWFNQEEHHKMERTTFFPEK